jgi:8-oxo-dGTP pyrophosphatase MutT (NUDIX family)
MSVADAALRVILTGAHQILRAGWFVRRPRTFGAHALALTPERKLILVKLRYAAGWRLPGGGRGKNEDPADAALRELREEIGMTDYGAVKKAAELEQRPNYRRDLVSLVVVENVQYRPRWSWEIERIIEVDPHQLPEGMSPLAEEWIAALRENL